MARTLSRRSVNPKPADEDDEDETTEAAEETSRPARRRGGSDEAPARKRRGSDDDGETRSSLGSGWDAHKKNKAKSSKFNAEDRFSAEENDEYLIRFLDDAPFATWNEHFLREVDGKKSFVCAENKCPICESGDTPSYRAAFNIVVFDGDGNPAVKYWIATPDPLDAIEAHAFNERYKPLTNPENYFVVQKKKNKAKRFHYTVERIKDRDLNEEFGFDPLSEQELDELAADKFETKDAVKPSTLKELRNAAEELD